MGATGPHMGPGSTLCPRLATTTSVPLTLLTLGVWCMTYPVAKAASPCGEAHLGAWASAPKPCTTVPKGTVRVKEMSDSWSTTRGIARANGTQCIGGMGPREAIWCPKAESRSNLAPPLCQTNDLASLPRQPHRLAMVPPSDRPVIVPAMRKLGTGWRVSLGSGSLEKALTPSLVLVGRRRGLPMCAIAGPAPVLTLLVDIEGTWAIAKHLWQGLGTSREPKTRRAKG